MRTGADVLMCYRKAKRLDATRGDPSHVQPGGTYLVCYHRRQLAGATTSDSSWVLPWATACRCYQEGAVVSKAGRGALWCRSIGLVAYRTRCTRGEHADMSSEVRLECLMPYGVGLHSYVIRLWVKTAPKCERLGTSRHAANRTCQGSPTPGQS